MKEMVYHHRETVLIMFVLFGIGLFYLLTLRDGHEWGGDFCAYIHHAKNIAEGIDYKETGFIVNPHYPTLGPNTYPPIFPLLLVPVYKLFGMNLTAMKAEIILFFLGFLFIFYLIFINSISFPYQIVLLLLIGFNPFFWEFKDDIRPDIPFLFFLFFAFFFIQRVYSFDLLKKASFWQGIVLGFLIYLPYGTRSVGILLIPCLLLLDFMRFKRLTRLTLIAGLTFLFLLLLQILFFHNDCGYGGMWKGVVTQPNILLSLLKDLLILAHSYAAFWTNDYFRPFEIFLSVLIMILFLIGFLSRIKKGIMIIEIFLPLYLLVIWPIYVIPRHLFPVIPLILFYVFEGFSRVRSLQQRRLRHFLFLFLIVAIVGSYIGKYSKKDFGPIQETVYKYEMVELFDFLREKTDAKDVLIFRKPRVLSLYTGRKASVYHQFEPSDDGELWDYFDKIRATHLLTSPVDKTYWPSFIERHQASLEEVFSNQDFKVYRIKRFPLLKNNN
jgi:hypothetical protein